MMKITKKNYTQIFGITVVLLAIFRCASIDRAAGNGAAVASADTVSTDAVADSVAVDGMDEITSAPVAEIKPIGRPSLFFNADGTPVKTVFTVYRILAILFPIRMMCSLRLHSVMV